MLEDGTLRRTMEDTPQGGVVSLGAKVPRRASQGRRRGSPYHWPAACVSDHCDHGVVRGARLVGGQEVGLMSEVAGCLPTWFIPGCRRAGMAATWTAQGCSRKR